MHAGFARNVSAEFKRREANEMINSVPVLMLGLVIISALGSLVGYLIEPGRFEHRGAAEPAMGLSVAESQPQDGDHSPRWAA
jgi:hypothetical protein